MTIERLERRVRFLTAYAAGSTLVFVVLLLGAFGYARRERFTEIDVERINVVEPDGRLAVVISNEARMPGGIMNGKEIAHRDGDAGLIFYNSEGDEAGGLIQHSERSPDGAFRSAYGQLSLDRFESDQVVTLRYTENEGGWSAGLHASDFPRHVITEFAAAMDSIERLPESERQRAVGELRRRFMAEGKFEIPRVFVGDHNRTALVDLRDTSGRTRIRMYVDSLDVARLEFLDDEGRVVTRLPEN